MAAMAIPAVAHADLGPKVNGCGDVRFVGVKGSGETGTWDDYGREMATLSAEIELALPDWVEYRSTQVNYPAYGIELLWTAPIGGVGQYAGGIEDGDDALRDLLRDIREECPNELEILGGYSSGAMVVHDILDEIAGDSYWQSRVVGVHLLADPRRNPFDPSTRGGAPKTTMGIAAIGALVTDLHGIASVPAVFDGVTRSWCVVKDPVCALGADDLTIPGLAAIWLVNKQRHGNYGGAILPDLFRTDAARLTQRLEYTFPPVDQNLGRTATGWPVNVDLSAGFDHPVRFTGISPAIPGLKLSTNGLLSGVVPAVGTYAAEVTAFTSRAGTSRFEVMLNVVEPFEMVDFETEPITIAPLPVHQPTGIVIPTVPARAAVTIEPGDDMPPGLTLSSTGKIQGRPDVVGTSSVGVRVAAPDGSLRRFHVDLHVVNPARPVTSAPDGTLADSDTYGGAMLDDRHVAFISAATNLGVDNPNGSYLVYLKDMASGTLAHWTPPGDESPCSLQTDDDKTNLYITTTWWRDFTNENGDPDSEEHTTVRRLPLAGHEYSTGAIAPETVTSFIGSCDSGAAIGASSALGVAVVSQFRLDLPEQPFAGQDQPQSVYFVAAGTGSVRRVAGPRVNGVTWSPVAIVDVRSNGALLVRTRHDVSGRPLDNYFMLNPNGTWREVDLAASEQALKMQHAQFYAGGLVFLIDPGDLPLPSATTARLAAASSSTVLRFKPFGAADPEVLDSYGRQAAFGFAPLTGGDYTVDCRLYDRAHPTRVQPATVYYAGETINSCIAGPGSNVASPFSAAGTTNMLVYGNIGGASQLLVAAIP